MMRFGHFNGEEITSQIQKIEARVKYLAEIHPGSQPNQDQSDAFQIHFLV